MKKLTKIPPLNEIPYISSVQDIILKSSEKYGYKIALEDLIEYPIHSVTYNLLYNIIIKFGKSLLAIGLEERDHIAIIGENRVQWCIAYLTGMCFNLVVVPLDKNATHNDLLNMIHESDTKAVIYSKTFEEFLFDNRELLNKVKYYIGMDLQKSKDNLFSMLELINNQSSEIVELPEINPAELAEIIFTSGSLGRAKGVMLSQKNISSNLMAMIQMIKIDPDDKFLGVLPIHHTYQCTCGFLCPLYAGASVHFARSLKTLGDDLNNVGATVLLGAPLLYNKMYNKIVKTIKENKTRWVIVSLLRKISAAANSFHIGNPGRLLFRNIHNRLGGNLRLLIAGGAAPDPEVLKGFRDFGFNIVQGYGLTETSPILTLNRIDFFKDEAAGFCLPGVTIRINEPDINKVGEIYAKGENIFMGYYNNEQATRDTFDKDWFKTGDIGFIDNDGFLHICGRKKNVIIANNGENVYPEELEDLLNRSQFILESIVYSQQDNKHTEVITAQVYPDTEAFIDYLLKNNVQLNEKLINDIITKEIKSVNRQLAQCKQIRKFNINEKEFEKTTTQKIKRHSVITGQAIPIEKYLIS